jgi:hypothetical protein
MVSPDIPTGPLAEPAAISPGRWGAIPRTYISNTGDYAIPPAAQQLFIEEADKLTPGNQTEARELAASHCPFLSQPNQLASILLQLCPGLDCPRRAGQGPPAGPPLGGGAIRALEREEAVRE